MLAVTRANVNVASVVQFLHHIYAAFGFSDVTIELSTRPDKSIGSDEVWELAEGVLTRTNNVYQAGDHLLEVTSDSSAEYLLTADVNEIGNI